MIKVSENNVIHWHFPLIEKKIKNQNRKGEQGRCYEILIGGSDKIWDLFL